MKVSDLKKELDDVQILLSGIDVAVNSITFNNAYLLNDVFKHSDLKNSILCDCEHDLSHASYYVTSVIKKIQQLIDDLNYEK